MTEQLHIGSHSITVLRFNTVIVGAGAAGMNCAKKLVEYRTQHGTPDPSARIAVVTAGLPLGASRMSGSDKQTYYKLGTSPDAADSAESFAQSLTAAGCCHADLALAEGIGSLRAFYALVEAGVPFPTDAMGACIGYKTDHDPYERATSAGPKTSRMMAECLETIVRRYGVPIFDHHDAVDLLTDGDADQRRIIGLVTLDKKRGKPAESLCLFLADNFVLAAGGPGALYETTVYPPGQTGLHGLALRAGLAAENLTESQFGLAAVPFRWNVSGSYMQAVPRFFSTDAHGRDQRDFLADAFPTMSQMAAAIFLKGYQWPFDAQRVTDFQSSLIDLLVTQETQNGRRVFLDFRHNPLGTASMRPFALEELEPEAINYLTAAGATQPLPIDRLAHMNPPAIDIFKEHGIDLSAQPLEVAVCAQHNNGGVAVDIWWQSTLPHTFVIGEMAATHGVKRPGGAALNAGQVGAQRAAEYIANVYPDTLPDVAVETGPLKPKLQSLIARLGRLHNPAAPRTADQALADIRRRMTAAAAHLRRRQIVQNALTEALELLREIAAHGLRPDAENPNDWPNAIRAEHLALTSVACLKAIVELLNADAGSRGSYLVLTDDGTEIHPRLKDPATDRTLRFKPENQSLRRAIQRLTFDPAAPDLFRSEMLPPRQPPARRKAFEPAWADYRTAAIYRTP
jgi:succinate dehydrogenase/fumarate reductase flavoprotein subunit